MIIDKLLLSTLPSDRMYEFNLNWILKRIKDLSKDTENIKQIVETLKEEIKQFEDDIQKQYNDLLEYVENYFKNLDLTSEVNDIIDDMMKRGEFDIFFKPIILYANKEGRNIKRLYAYGADAVSPDLYGVGAEGFCRHLNNWYQCFKSRNDEIGNIAVFNNNFEQISISDNLTNLGHANSMFYDRGMLFIATINQGIAVVDAETLQPIINLNVPTATCNGVGVDNGHYYYTDYNYVYEFTFDRATLTGNFELKTDLRGNYDVAKCQGFDVYKDNYYILQSGTEVLLRYNFYGDFINQYIITTDKNFVGEVQDLQITDSGDVLFNATIRYPYYQHTYTYYYKTDLKGLVKIEKPVFNVIPQDATIYVNKNRYSKNPTGKANAPFNTIGEALIFITNSEKYDCPYTLMIQSANHDEEIIYLNGVNLRIAPDGLSERIRIKALLCNNSKLTSNLLDIKNDCDDFLALYLNNSDVTLINVSSYDSVLDTQGRYALMYLTNLTFNNLVVSGASGGTAESTYSTITTLTNNPFTNGVRSLNLKGVAYRYADAERPTINTLHTEDNPLIIPIPDNIKNAMTNGQTFSVFVYMPGSVNHDNIDSTFLISNITEINMTQSHLTLFFDLTENVKVVLNIVLTNNNIKFYVEFKTLSDNSIKTYTRVLNVFRVAELFCL